MVHKPANQIIRNKPLETMLLELLCILLLSIPLIWECWDDRDGDVHWSGLDTEPKNDDWILRALLMLLSSVAVFFLHPTKNFFQALLMSFAIFTLFFPYLINFIHYKRGVTSDPQWWNHLSKTAIPDKWPAWRGLHWSVRLLILLMFFGIALKVYLCWGKLISFYNEC